MTNPLLTVRDLTMRFGGLTAIGDLSFNAARKQITALHPWMGKHVTVHCLPHRICPESRPDGCALLLELGGGGFLGLLVVGEVGGRTGDIGLCLLDAGYVSEEPRSLRRLARGSPCRPRPRSI